MYYKEKASWLPKPYVFAKQIIISIVSYCTLPFYKEKKDGIKRFFTNNYYDKPDGLIFDGTSSGYFDRVNLLIDLFQLEGKCFVDLGCGQGSFLMWLKHNAISYQEYQGIDFAINHHIQDESSVFINDNILNAYKYIQNSNDIITMCNSLCYITDEDFCSILSSLESGNRIIIIDPSPNLFWDAHFDGVKPIYRGLRTVMKMLTENGFRVDSSMQDYLFKIGKVYCSPLSFGIFATKE